MIELLWTRSTAPLSKAIRWALDEPVSHFAILMDDRLVFHSNLIGTHLKWKTSFEKKAEIVYSLRLNLSSEEEEEIYQRLIQLDERPYDLSAFLYFAFHGLKHRLLQTPIPTKNPWATNRGLLCTEVSKALTDFVALPTHLDIITPYQLYWFILKHSEPDQLSLPV